MSFDKWRARLREETVVNFLIPDDKDEGYYRKPFGKKGANGRVTIEGYTPVALFMEGGVIQGLWGSGRDMRAMTDDELSDESLWSWLVGNPIPYEVYKAVAEDGATWPEMEPPKLDALKREEPAAEGQRLAENQSPADAKPKAPETAEEHKAAIDVIVASSAEVKDVLTTDEASIVGGTINAIAERRLAADKAGKALYKPPFDQYKKLFAAWTPMLKTAETEEKRLQKIVLTFRQREHERVGHANALAAQAQIDEEARNERAADRAIANAEPEPSPEVAEPDPPPRAVAPLKPTYGTRTVREEEQTFVEIVDEAQLATFFRGTEELRTVLHTLAVRAVKRGETVPGITTRKGLV